MWCNTGSLTNLSILFLTYPDIKEKISRIVMMGGAIDVPGNKNRVAEFNMFVDPEAADIVFKSKLKKQSITILQFYPLIRREELRSKRKRRNPSIENSIFRLHGKRGKTWRNYIYYDFF